MIVLGAEDKIRGDASAGAVVDYTIHGFAGGEATLFANGQLAAATGDLYTAPASGSYPAGGIIIKTIILVNTDSSDRTVNLYLLPNGGTARRILPKDLSIAIGESYEYEG